MSEHDEFLPELATEAADVTWVTADEYFAYWIALCETALALKIPPDALEGIEILSLAGAVMADADFARRGMPQEGSVFARDPLVVAKEMTRTERLALRNRLRVLGIL